MDKKYLIFVPTYNEKENVTPLIETILGLNLPNTDLLFIDDNSPDGTGNILEELKNKYSNLIIKHRTGKLGIGSAHIEGINWAYEQKYDFVITMDCDFTHPPEYIPEMIKKSETHNVVVTSRYLEKNGLKEWNLFRKSLTLAGHLLTRFLLRLRYDATGAFRIYSLNSIDSKIFKLVKSKGYSFFFESLFILNYNKYSILEIPITLPARTYGHSKMRITDVWNSLKFLIYIFVVITVSPKKYKL